MDFVADLWCYAKQRKKLWLLPSIVVLLLVGTIIVSSSGSALAPFIYSVF